MKYIISDTHFNHKLLMDLPGGANRPKDYKKLLLKGLRRLKRLDTLIQLGDVCIGKDAEMHDRYIVPLQYRKVLVLGNHDSKSKNWYLSHGRDEVHDVLLLVDDLGKTENRGLYRLRGRNVLLSHQPILEMPEGRYNIHGHYHDRMIKPISDFHKLYSPEKEGYVPKELWSFF